MPDRCHDPVSGAEVVTPACVKRCESKALIPEVVRGPQRHLFLASDLQQAMYVLQARVPNLMVEVQRSVDRKVDNQFHWPAAQTPEAEPAELEQLDEQLFLLVVRFNVRNSMRGKLSFCPMCVPAECVHPPANSSTELPKKMDKQELVEMDKEESTELKMDKEESTKLEMDKEDSTNFEMDKEEQKTPGPSVLDALYPTYPSNLPVASATEAFKL